MPLTDTKVECFLRNGHQCLDCVRQGAGACSQLAMAVESPPTRGEILEKLSQDLTHLPAFRRAHVVRATIAKREVVIRKSLRQTHEHMFGGDIAPTNASCPETSVRFGGRRIDAARACHMNCLHSEGFYMEAQQSRAHTCYEKIGVGQPIMTCMTHE